MKLRNFELEDAPLMLEWMHDPNVVFSLKKDFSNTTLKDVKKYILDSRNITHDINLAICSDENEYVGTVSLKNIDRNNQSAEFFIVIRSCAMGKGYAWFGMEEIILKGFKEYGLESIYWCVSRSDIRGIRFFDKHNFHEFFDVPTKILNRYSSFKHGQLKWYNILKGDSFDNRLTVAGCKIIHIKTIPTVDAGELSFFENSRDIPFDIKRIYYISKVPEGVRRGFHAHKKLKQLIFCPYGRIQLILENSKGREEIELSDPSVGVVVESPTWREMLWLQKDSVLCVAASDLYSADDYIRDYSEFKNKFIKDHNRMINAL